MQLSVRVTPNAARAEVTGTGAGAYRVRVDARPERGRANERLIEILAEHFSVPRSSVRILRGARGRDKVVSISP